MIINCGLGKHKRIDDFEEISTSKLTLTQG